MIASVEISYSNGSDVDNGGDSSVKDPVLMMVATVVAALAVAVSSGGDVDDIDCNCGGSGDDGSSGRTAALNADGDGIDGDGCQSQC